MLVTIFIVPTIVHVHVASNDIHSIYNVQVHVYMLLVMIFIVSTLYNMTIFTMYKYMYVMYVTGNDFIVSTFTILSYVSDRLCLSPTSRN